MMTKLLFSCPNQNNATSFGLLIYRLVFGGFMLFGHGWGKMMNFSTLSEKFPDPLGIGVTMSLGGAVFSETVFALLIMLGLATRLSALPLMFTMCIAAFIVHGEGPWFLPGQGAKEPALMYLMAFGLLLFTGPGQYSIDAKLSK